jgi:sulfate/thiosulfate transport system ATP-binding protein
MSIVLDRLTKIYGGHSIVDQVSLELTDGEFFVMLGSSGSGKSTILRLIAGLAQPDTGRILLRGRDVTSLPPQQRGTGFVFQNYSIFRHMSVSQNVEFGLKIRNAPAEERARKSEQLLDLVGLAGLGSRYADQLSGGQLQRVALARALAYEPSILLLDEPFGALDSKIRAQLRRSLKEIQRRLAVTTILVTHDQEEAFELADRIGVIEHGRLLETGTPAALYFTPKSLFVATFLGAGTVLAGRADGAWAHFGPLCLPIPPETSYEEGAKAQVLFRPEQVALSDEEPGSEAAVIGKGTVVERIFSGPLQRVRVQLPHLAATRQVAPPVPFGEEGLLVDASVPSELRLESSTVWVSLRAWHILEQPRPRLLVYTGESELMTPSPCISLARALSEKINASATILAVTGERKSGETLNAALRYRQTKQGLVRADPQIRYGNAAEQIIQAQHLGLYDLMLMGPEGHAGTTLHRVLERSSIPVLIVRNKQKIFERILICTAAGEPGKSDVWAGGRLARWLNAEVTLLYVTPKGSEGLSAVARRHLERAIATLRGLEVKGVIQIRSAEKPKEGILAELQAGNHDLVVVGVHGSRSHARTRSMFGIDDITLQVLNEVDRAVLVVPTEER